MTNFPNGVASFGMPMLPALMGLPVGGGKVFWVDSGYTGGATDGSFSRPYLTLEAALNGGRVVASNGDVIYIKPGHAETISSASSLSLDLAGVSIVGLGIGNQRPTFTFTTATTATINVSAADILVANCVFSANFDSVAQAFSLTTANNFTLLGCRFRDANLTDVSFVNIVDTDAVANNADGLSIIGCQWISEDNASGAMIDADATIARLTVKDCVISHSVATTVGKIAEAATDVQFVELLVEGNSIYSAATDSTGGLLITGTCATSYGWIVRNSIQALDAAGVVFLNALTTPITMVDNWYSGAAAEPRAINSVGGTIYNDA